MAASRPTLSNTTIPTPVLRERRALLQRVLWSHQIEKSGRIRDFLLYVCERALQEPSVEIHEQEIGYRVFGRNEDYDTSADNIVRVTASQARKKLDQYFASGGASEPTILEIPKGKYTPAFIERGPTAPEIATQREQRPQLAIYRRVVFILAACVLLLGMLAVWQGVRLRTTRLAASSLLNSNPALESLWSQLLPSTGRTDIVVADSSLSLFEELLDHQLTLSEYLKPNQWLTAGELSSNPELKAFAQLAAQRGFTSMASVTTGYRIAQLVGRDQGRISILRARDFNMPQMKFDNVILLGSTRANPWEELIQGRLNFRYGYDQKSRYSYFENLNPRPGELKIYRTDSTVSYCRLAFVPNLAGTGNILSISGTEIEGTAGGGEFVTSERSLAQLRSVVEAGHTGRMPYFEALLKSSRVGGETPGLSMVAFRVLQP